MYTHQSTPVVLLFSGLGRTHEHSLSPDLSEPTAHKLLLDGGIILNRSTKKAKIKETRLKGKEEKNLTNVLIDTRESRVVRGKC